MRRRSHKEIHPECKSGYQFGQLEATVDALDAQLKTTRAMAERLQRDLTDQRMVAQATTMNHTALSNNVTEFSDHLNELVDLCDAMEPQLKELKTQQRCLETRVSSVEASAAKSHKRIDSLFSWKNKIAGGIGVLVVIGAIVSWALNNYNQWLAIRQQHEDAKKKQEQHEHPSPGAVPITATESGSPVQATVMPVIAPVWTGTTPPNI